MRMEHLIVGIVDFIEEFFEEFNKPHRREGYFYIAPNGVPSACAIHFFKVKEKDVVVFEEINQGMSVTNASETIATGVVKFFNLDVENTVFFEHYPKNMTMDDEETFDLIIYKWINRQKGDYMWLATNPRWRRISLPEERSDQKKP